MAAAATEKNIVMLPVVVTLFMLFSLHDALGERPKHLLFQAGTGHRSAPEAIADAFEKRHPDLKVDFSYNRSGYFLEDMASSRKGDLYMPGEEFYFLQAQKRGFIAEYHPETDIPAYFIPVIVTPRGNPKNIHSIADFANPGIRVGLGDSINACSIGRWHKIIFTKAGIWDNVRKNAAMRAVCISELCNACCQKEIDAAIVWSSAAMLFLKDIAIVPLEPHYREIIRIPVAVLTFSKYPKEAKAFKEFILSDKGKTIFHNHAYCIDPDKVDDAIKWLAGASRAVEDPSIPVTEETVGPFVERVKRLRAAGKK